MLGIYPADLKSYGHTKTYMQTFIAALAKIGSRQKLDAGKKSFNV